MLYERSSTKGTKQKSGWLDVMMLLFASEGHGSGLQGLQISGIERGGPLGDSAPHSNLAYRCSNSVGCSLIRPLYQYKLDF